MIKKTESKGNKPPIIEIVNPEQMLLEEAEMKEMTRDNIALTYAFALRQRDEVDFKKVNKAIINRWSLSGLKYIKEKAWRTNVR